MNQRSHLLILQSAIAQEQLQQQIEVWQALLEKLGGSERSRSSPFHPRSLIGSM
jgi:hypothetical protein